MVLPPIRLEHDPNIKLTLRRKELELLTQCADQVFFFIGIYNMNLIFIF